MMTSKVTQEARPQLLRDTMKVYSDNLAQLESVVEVVVRAMELQKSSELQSLGTRESFRAHCRGNELTSGVQR